jgi:hypothetical protein
MNVIFICYCPPNTQINKLDKMDRKEHYMIIMQTEDTVKVHDTYYMPVLLQIRDLCLGTQFPTIKSVSVNDAVLHPQYQHIEMLELCLDLEYSGGFQLSIDANMVLGKAAYLSVKGLFVTYAKGSFMFIYSDFRICLRAMTPYCYETISKTFRTPSSGKDDGTFFSVAAKNPAHLIFHEASIHVLFL